MIVLLLASQLYPGLHIPECEACNHRFLEGSPQSTDPEQDESEKQNKGGEETNMKVHC